MIRIYFLLSIFLAALAGAGELPWIGVSLTSPKPEDRQAAEIAEGVGLKVMKVASGSPLAKAGGRTGDLWWKFDGQILVNQRQMLVLLKSKSPGERVEIEYFRNLEQMSLTLVLGSRDLQQVYSVGTRGLEGEDSRILAKREQIARMTTDNKDLSLQREGKGWRFEVLEKGTSVLSSLVTESDLNDKVPSKWHGPFLVLKLTLEQMEPQPTDVAERRTRYVPRKKSSVE